MHVIWTICDPGPGRFGMSQAGMETRRIFSRSAPAMKAVNRVSRLRTVFPEFG